MFWLGIIVAGLAALVLITPLVDRWRQRILRRCLRDVCDVLNAHGIDYWCDFGTLLGCFRDGDIIRRDYDVDLCILAAERTKVAVLSKAFQERGYTFRDANGTTRRVIRISNNRTRYYVDLYHYTPDGAWLRSPYHAEDDVPAGLVGNRTARPFLGGDIRVPGDIESLLVHRYGPDFMTPRRGDRGAAYTFSRVETFVRILENNCVGLWSMLRSMRGTASAASR